jgi:hypothetical protein
MLPGGFTGLGKEEEKMGPLDRIVELAERETGKAQEEVEAAREIKGEVAKVKVGISDCLALLDEQMAMLGGNDGAEKKNGEMQLKLTSILLGQ